MKRIATSWFLISLAVGCSTPASQQAGGGGGGGGGGTSKVADLRVELASVTLADDCGGTNMPPPVVVKTADASAAKQPPRPPADEPAAAQPMCQPGEDCGGGHRQACEQTSMQLAFTSTLAQPSKIEVKKIELLDDRGQLLGELTAQPAMRWGSDRYEAWDQMVPASQTISTSYALSAPPYDKMGGRHQAHDKRFQLRVTVSVGGKDQTVEKKAIAPAMLEPAVPT